MEIKKQKKKIPKEVKTFSLEKSVYEDFRKECKSWNLNMSEIIGQFIKRVTKLLKSGEGGEVVFGVEGGTWKQPEKIIYDGREITEREGVRQLKEGNNQ